MKLRLPNKLWAALVGYFWADCPLCGQMFGGHEWRDIDGKTSQIPNGKPGGGTAICPDCTRADRGCEPEPIYLRFNLDEIDEQGYAT